ncbi:hypothetical protein LF817_12090 [Halobacillus sp. A1]|uniref:hypothetical protein n=1 Tax=Halobacillus sp. A1 TaxID=2880262 RepID=UPI0020A6B31E|nr:hypothetical protein [Halobacillus sp. A1]MCP3032087.1 hypothetical protein [Halobacillus sp. A1]
MTKHIEAFFRTENDGESAKAELQKLSTQNEMVEPIPEQSRLTGVVPVLNQSQSSGGVAAGGVAGFGDFLKSDKNTSREDTPTDVEHLTYLLHFDVKDDEYQEALSILKNHDGHMDQDKI